MAGRRVEFDITGLTGASASFRRAGEAALPRAEAVVRKVSSDITADARTLAPVDTGNLRSSITETVVASGQAVDAEIGPTAAYGDYVERGTSRQAPQPYMAPAFDRHQAFFTQAMERIAAMDDD